MSPMVVWVSCLLKRGVKGERSPKVLDLDLCPCRLCQSHPGVTSLLEVLWATACHGEVHNLHISLEELSQNLNVIKEKRVLEWDKKSAAI